VEKNKVITLILFFFAVIPVVNFYGNAALNVSSNQVQYLCSVWTNQIREETKNVIASVIYLTSD